MERFTIAKLNEELWDEFLESEDYRIADEQLGGMRLTWRDVDSGDVERVVDLASDAGVLASARDGLRWSAYLESDSEGGHLTLVLLFAENCLWPKLATEYRHISEWLPTTDDDRFTHVEMARSVVELVIDEINGLAYRASIMAAEFASAIPSDDEPVCVKCNRTATQDDSCADDTYGKHLFKEGE